MGFSHFYDEGGRLENYITIERGVVRRSDSRRSKVYKKQACHVEPRKKGPDGRGRAKTKRGKKIGS